MNPAREHIGRAVRWVEGWIDGRDLRERAILAAGSVTVLVAVWCLVGLDPATARSRELTAAATEIERELAGLEAQASEIRAAHDRDPNEELRARGGALRQQIAAVDESIRAHTVSLVPPREMAHFLEDLLADRSELKLVRIENLGAEPLLAAAEREAAGDLSMSGARVYKHAFEVELEGRYLAALGYLEALEALPWGFFWEGLRYEVDEYPRGRATLRAYTLSSEEEWIGV